MKNFVSIKTQIQISNLDNMLQSVLQNLSSTAEHKPEYITSTDVQYAHIQIRFQTDTNGHCIFNMING